MDLPRSSYLTLNTAWKQISRQTPCFVCSKVSYLQYSVMTVTPVCTNCIVVKCQCEFTANEYNLNHLCSVQVSQGALVIWVGTVGQLACLQSPYSSSLTAQIPRTMRGSRRNMQSLLVHHSNITTLAHCTVVPAQWQEYISNTLISNRIHIIRYLNTFGGFSLMGQLSCWNLSQIHCGLQLNN